MTSKAVLIDSKSDFMPKKKRSFLLTTSFSVKTHPTGTGGLRIPVVSGGQLADILQGGLGTLVQCCVQHKESHGQ